ncbi:MAG TPA: class I SAM-dependent methyltransferase [Candidatus Pacearchaeota archaeon]|nr:class I SAM-dependent methyltransferase [Candidatus Pacearchaeota archaeon]
MKNFDYHEAVFRDLPNSYKKWIDEEKKFLRGKIKKDSKVLEVGCGDGRSLKDIIDITQNLVGIDIDKNAVIIAKKNFEKYPEVNIIEGDGRKLPFENATFDFVICMTSFVNFDNNKYIILEEMGRVLKNKGEIIMSVFNEDAFDERMKIYKKLKAPIIKTEGTKVIFDKSLGANTSEQFSKEELDEIFNKESLKINEIKKAGIGYVLSATKK